MNHICSASVLMKSHSCPWSSALFIGSTLQKLCPWIFNSRNPSQIHICTWMKTVKRLISTDTLMQTTVSKIKAWTSRTFHLQIKLVFPVRPDGEDICRNATLRSIKKKDQKRINKQIKQRRFLPNILLTAFHVTRALDF